MEPTPSPHPEQAPQSQPTAPETAPSQVPERLPTQPESESSPPSRAEQAPTLPPVTVPAPQPQVTVPATQPQPGQADVNAPADASDVDLIEKEWVNRAKQVIDTTKDDPHAQEAGFEQLQVEYQKKRYGRNIKPAH